MLELPPVARGRGCGGSRRGDRVDVTLAERRDRRAVLQAEGVGAQEVADAAGGHRFAEQADHPDDGLEGLTGPRRLVGRQPAMSRFGLDAGDRCDLRVLETDRVVQELGDLRWVCGEIAGVKMGRQTAPPCAL
jgi:hypothetical protein